MFINVECQHLKTIQRKRHSVWQYKHSTIPKMLCFVLLRYTEVIVGGRAKCMVPQLFIGECALLFSWLRRLWHYAQKASVADASL